MRLKICKASKWITVNGALGSQPPKGVYRKPPGKTRPGVFIKRGEKERAVISKEWNEPRPADQWGQIKSLLN
jgi:hypothetical protein